MARITEYTFSPHYVIYIPVSVIIPSTMPETYHYCSFSRWSDTICTFVISTAICTFDISITIYTFDISTVIGTFFVRSLILLLAVCRTKCNAQWFYNNLFISAPFSPTDQTSACKLCLGQSTKLQTLSNLPSMQIEPIIYWQAGIALFLLKHRLLLYALSFRNVHVMLYSTTRGTEHAPRTASWEPPWHSMFW